MSLDELRDAVAAASRQLAAGGLVHATAGNVSAVAGEHIAITPTGARLDGLRAQDITVLDRSGAVLEGAEPTSEVALHLGAIERLGAGAVVHAHAPFATALSCVLEGEVPCVHYEMLMLGGAVRIAPYTTYGTPELAAGVLDALEGRSAALMASHGALTVGRDLASAMQAMEILEWSCGVYWRACQVGEPRVLSDAERRAFYERW
ncbi:MAG: L-fuculose-phosphate aldolase [Solirubrobacterales bacterium]|nr:L-fuculose-phosphate aldolase [Solirubrobacterales bacterium]